MDIQLIFTNTFGRFLTEQPVKKWNLSDLTNIERYNENQVNLSYLDAFIFRSIRSYKWHQSDQANGKVQVK